MKVATKVSGAFTVLMLILAALLVYHVRTIHQAVSTNFELSGITSRLYLSTTQQIALINQMEENAGKFWVTREPGYRELFDRGAERFDAALRELDRQPLNAEERAEVDELLALWSEFGSLAETLDSSALLSDPPAQALRTQTAMLRLQTRRVSEASQLAMRDRLEASVASARGAERISWVAAGGTLLLALLIFWWIVRSISRPLTKLQRGTHEVAEGNFAYRLDVGHDDEFAQLSMDFNQMTRRLAELDRMKRGFLSKVSHDLKTPLASMQETVGVMLDGVAGPVTAQQRRMLELTRQSAERLSAMIARILDLSAMEAGAATLDVADHDLAALVTPSLDALALGDPGRAPRVKTRMPTAPARIRCDRDRVVQVLVNLLENAAKFSPPGEPIEISARLTALEEAGVPGRERVAVRLQPDRPDVVLFEVADRGPGVAAADRERIFEHFVQANGGPAGDSRGVGLGLAICREIVDLHGGAIWIRPRPGGGSVFSVVLPGASAVPAAPLGRREAPVTIETV
jgi:signal transduction histidine kinase